MSLTEDDKAAVLSLWGKISNNPEAIGAEVLHRLLSCFPQTRIYFSHFDLSRASAHIRAHGAKIMGVIGEAVQHMDNLDDTLSWLGDLHAYTLKVDPGNFRLFTLCILCVLAAHFQADFTPEVHAAWEKFLTSIAAVLISKYR
ncbi:hemoglobin subunit pi [Microcaecilia unicolor]|uniref:Hemoglobin subunit pi-like n=1 Tax=Microcaecilia unicolor TaxID=1415580 RepID=A0A6P7YLN1_9AMPH|nr:hemoglobin subunit pi-like [Microcaecilia unicolor]